MRGLAMCAGAEIVAGMQVGSQLTGIRKEVSGKWQLFQKLSVCGLRAVRSTPGRLWL